MKYAKRAWPRLRKGPVLPPARALREGSQLVPKGPTLSTRMSYVSRRIKPAGELVVAHVLGLLPLVAIVALGFGLVWASALASAP
jgi:hypothetical protein